jgi:putative intracellular protease/amidase
MRVLRILLLILICGSFPALSQAQNATQPAPANAVVGDWAGALGNYQVLMHVKHGPNGELSATADSVSEDKWGIPVAQFAVRGDTVHFAADQGRYDGRIVGDQIIGEWKENSESQKLTFRRITAARAAEIAAQAPHPMRVAFVLSAQFDMIDFAGPWEVFSDVMTYPNGEMQMPIHTYTVAATRDPIGSGDSAVVPQFTFADAPKPDIIVVPAQSGSPQLLEWLRKQNAEHVTIMSVCTGARQLAEAGLLDGHSATSHHLRLAELQKRFPKVQWVADRRWVQVTDNIFTAGGLTSGIDLALHLVDTRLGRDVAQSTADYLEYRGDGWKNPVLAARAQQ